MTAPNTRDDPHLGEFEHLAMLAVLRLGTDAYGIPVREEIVRRAQRPVSYGAVYSALRRMEAKGWLEPQVGEPEPVPGGRAKKFYRITASGRAALDRAREELARMAEGLEGLGPAGDH